MKIDETIISINDKARTYSKFFLAMGVTATAIAQIPSINLQLWGILFVLTGAVSWASLTVQNIIKNKILGREAPDLGIGAYPSLYKIPFNNRFNAYLKNSENDIERKFKIILTSYALKKLVIEPSTVFNNVSDKEYNWNVKYNILNSEGKSEPLFDFVTRHVDYMDLTANDFKDPKNLEIAKKVYQDFANLGEEEFIFEIIENNPEHIEVLRNFYTLHHVHKNNCSYPELIKHLDNLFIISKRKDKLDTMLIEKPQIPVKTKKL